MDIPHCVATPEELAGQRKRQARLATGLLGIDRAGPALIVSFAEDFDRAALEQMIKVESRCCPFFRFYFDEEATRLTVTVEEPSQLPALEAIASSLQAARQAA